RRGAARGRRRAREPGRTAAERPGAASRTRRAIRQRRGIRLQHEAPARTRHQRREAVDRVGGTIAALTVLSPEFPAMPSFRLLSILASFTFVASSALAAVPVPKPP